MNCRLWMCIVQCLSFLVTVCPSERDTGFCMSPDSIVIRCCIGFYNSGDNCIECEPGTTGNNCSLTCPPEFFGSQCREQCNCSLDKYCDPTSGCLANRSVITSTGSGRETSDTMTKNPKVSDSNHFEKTEILIVGILPFSVPVIVCFIIGMVCIRRVKIRKNSMHNVTDPPIRVHESAIDDTVSSDVHDHSNLLGPSPSFSTYPKDNTTAVREPEPCSGLTIDTTFHDNNKDYHVNQHPLPRTCEKISEKLDGSYLSMTHKKKLHEKTKHQQVDINLSSIKKDTEELLFINSNEGQQRNGKKTVKFECPEQIQDTADIEKKPRKEILASPVCTIDEKVNSYSCETMYSNNLFISDIQTDNSEDTDEYFNINYKGQITNIESVRSLCSSKASIDMVDYINCDALK